VYAIAGIVHFDPGAVAGAEGDAEALRHALSGAGYPSSETRTHAGATFAVARDAWVAGCRKSATLANDGEHLTAFVGRLDNVAALPTLPDQSTDPATIVADAHRRWNDQAPAHLLGDFVYAVWDARDRRLHLARDVGGWHILYYLRQADRVVFSDSLPVLLALAPDVRRLDPRVVVDVLVDGLPPVGRTIWRDIHAVAPASIAGFARGGDDIRRYWQLPQTSLRFARDDDYVDAARTLLDEAVRCRLPTHGAVGIALSGGLDSAGLAATAAAVAPDTAVFGFTGVPAPGVVLPHRPHQYSDERPYVQALSEQIPALQVAYTSSPVDAEDDINAAIVGLAGMPLNNTLNAAWLSPAYGGAAQRGVHSVLTGGFGNITLSYDGTSLLPALLDQGRLIRFATELAGLARQGGNSAYGLARSAIGNSRYFSRYRKMRRDPGLWPRQRLEWAFLADGFAESVDWLRYQLKDEASIPTNGVDHRAWHISRSQRQRHLDAPLQRYWRAEFAQPLADQRLIEFCMAIPLEQFLRRGETRYLARRVLSDRLPAAIVQNRLRGRQCPEAVQRVTARASHLLTELDRYIASPLVRHCLDVVKIRASLSRIGDTVPDEVVRVQYLHRTLQQVRFLDYLERLGATL
jgi:asparagine synthase (glutamine-hydrolysing)